MDSPPNIVSVSSQRLAAFQKRAVADRVPLNGSIAMTHRCNLRCVHCYLGEERCGGPGGLGESDTTFWCDVIDQIANAGCLNLLITGGEPLLRDDFVEIYSRAVRRGMLTTVFTNGTRIDEVVLDTFSALPPRLVEVTLYGASAATFDRVTGLPGSYRRCLDGLDALVHAGVHIGLKSMIMVENQHEVTAMRAMAHERGVQFRVDPALFPRRDGDAGPLVHRIPPDQAVALEMADEDFRRKAVDYFDRTRSITPEERLFSCLAGRTSFHIDPTGSLLPCLIVTSNGFDLHSGSFLTGWHEVTPHFLKQRVIPGYECNTCEKRVICGLCPAQFKLETGSAYEKVGYTCQLGTERYRALTERLVPSAD